MKDKKSIRRLFLYFSCNEFYRIHFFDFFILIILCNSINLFLYFYNIVLYLLAIKYLTQNV